jgi:hypothetical protein
MAGHLGGVAAEREIVRDPDQWPARDRKDSRLTRILKVAAHLKSRGHISEGSALIEYGRFRLADVIHRLRNERTDLLPEGTEIVTIHKRDTQGNPYGEYHLVTKSSASPRRRVERARSREDQAAPL